MPYTDLHGLPLTTASADAARAFNAAVSGYLAYRADVPARMRELMPLDPEFGLAHVLKGYFTLLGFNTATVPVAREALAAARTLLAQHGTERERMHLAALEHWAGGDVDATLKTWEEILDAYPLDVLAYRLHHFVAFWHGRPDLMGRRAEAAVQTWSPQLAGWGALLGCHCFANEELGNYAVAEKSGRAAIVLWPGDLWAAHGVAHIMEMQGRHDEGIAWLTGLEPHWDGGNNLKHHLWWHRGLYHFERREFDAVLDLYDHRFRQLDSTLTQSQPDLYIDVQNAASMLFRLERQGVDVGNRWVELADKAEGRIGDCLSVFTVPHWMMALAATGRWDAAARMLDALTRFADSGEGSAAPLVRKLGLPISQAILARAQGEPARACDLMRPALDGMSRLGGSHAQQDVLEQLFLDCAIKAQRKDDIRLLLDRVTRRFPVPPAQRIGYADAQRMMS